MADTVTLRSALEALLADNTSGEISPQDIRDFLRSVYLKAIITKTGAYTLTDDDATVLCDASGGAFTITLPTAVGRSGWRFDIKKIDATANVVTIDGDGSETIDGETAQIIVTQYNAITVISDGSNWSIL